MKKISVLLITALLVVALASCSGGTKEETTTSAPETTEQALPDVDLAIEKSQLADPDTFIAEMKGYGAEVSDMSDAGGGYIFTFSPDEHKKLLADKKSSTEKAFDEVKNKEDSYIEKIEFNENFKDVKVFVNREKYDMAESKNLEYSLAVKALAYQLYTGGWQSTFVKVVYSDTEELVQSFSLPAEISFAQ